MGTLQEQLKPLQPFDPSWNEANKQLSSSLVNNGNGRARCDKEFSGGKGKLIFLTAADALTFFQFNQKRYGWTDEQTPYRCKFYDHYHLTSLEVEEKPVAPNGWQKNTPLADLSKGMMTKSDKVRALLIAAAGTKTATEIAKDADCTAPLVNTIAKKEDLPLRRAREGHGTRHTTYARTTLSKPKSLSDIDKLMRELEAQKQELIRQEEEKKRVTLKKDKDGNTVIWANSDGVTVTETQLFQLYEILKQRFAKSGEVKVAKAV